MARNEMADDRRCETRGVPMTHTHTDTHADTDADTHAAIDVTTAAARLARPRGPGCPQRPPAAAQPLPAARERGGEAFRRPDPLRRRPARPRAAADGALRHPALAPRAAVLPRRLPRPRGRRPGHAGSPGGCPQQAPPWLEYFPPALAQNRFPPVFTPSDNEPTTNVEPPDPALAGSPVAARAKKSNIKVVVRHRAAARTAKAPASHHRPPRDDQRPCRRRRRGAASGSQERITPATSAGGV
ncbi:hypothetical protein SMICM304S_08421 [Streptomyces microflavus]